ncbi:MAG TPA: hypothetical protein VHB77_18185 [Planctomycetaceae bacterium]|nr:hypothetical protein [Planctomycetaceae bacterium]
MKRNIRLLLLAGVAGGCLWMMPAPGLAAGDSGYWDDYWHWYDNSFHPHFHRWYRLNGGVGAYTTEWSAPYYGTPPPQPQNSAYREGYTSPDKYVRGRALYSGMNEYWYPGDEIPATSVNQTLRPDNPPPYYAGSPWYDGLNSYYYPGDTVPHARLNPGSRPTVVDDVGY